ncbi:MAG: hypothetical protein VX223_11190 [Myxococcota bacterium]|nr:hypothetical protein [Myxococcota bacterium]
MTTKNVLTVFGAIMGLQAIGLFFGAEAISTEAFAALNPTETGIRIGTIMHQVAGVTSLTVALILLSSRSLAPAAGAKVLFGASVGLVFILVHGFYNLAATETKPPVPLLVIMSILAILGFITASKAQSQES